MRAPLLFVVVTTRVVRDRKRQPDNSLLRRSVRESTATTTHRAPWQHCRCPASWPPHDNRTTPTCALLAKVNLCVLDWFPNVDLKATVLHVRKRGPDNTHSESSEWEPSCFQSTPNKQPSHRLPLHLVQPRFQDHRHGHTLHSHQCKGRNEPTGVT